MPLPQLLIKTDRAATDTGMTLMEAVREGARTTTAQEAGTTVALAAALEAAAEAAVRMEEASSLSGRA